MYDFGADELVKEATLETASQLTVVHLVRSINVPGVTLLGLKGAALAARGDKLGALEAGVLPLLARRVGTKLGESTLRRFLALNTTSQTNEGVLENRVANLSACDWGIDFCGG